MKAVPQTDEGRPELYAVPAVAAAAGYSGAHN